MNKQTPLLFLGDSPASPTGLARIGKDLAILASGMPEFRVGYLGRGFIPSRKIPVMQYTFGEEYQWGEAWLEWVWKDFAGEEEGVIMTIWDPSRLHWFADPSGMPNERWMRTASFKRWGYFPVDATGPELGLTALAADTVRRFDRVLAYGMFGAEVLGASVGREVDWLPHGLNLNVFTPRDKAGAKVGMGLPQESLLLGIVMTNQERKDWGLAFATIALLKQKHKNLKVWCKTDSIDRWWDLRALTADYGLDTVILGDLNTYSDVELSYLYSACDLTFLPSLGEGFGYPIVESLACGVPCVHGKYGGGAELIQDPGLLVDPREFRLETRYNCKRPVYSSQDWAIIIDNTLGKIEAPEYYRKWVTHLGWENLGVQWKKWFNAGIKP